MELNANLDNLIKLCTITDSDIIEQVQKIVGNGGCPIVDRFCSLVGHVKSGTVLNYDHDHYLFMGSRVQVLNHQFAHTIRQARLVPKGLIVGIPSVADSMRPVPLGNDQYLVTVGAAGLSLLVEHNYELNPYPLIS